MTCKTDGRRIKASIDPVDSRVVSWGIGSKEKLKYILKYITQIRKWTDSEDFDDLDFYFVNSETLSSGQKTVGNIQFPDDWKLVVTFFSTPTD